MVENLYRILSFATGLALGTLFFGGLFLTVKKAVTAKMPALWFSVSFIFRVLMVLIGFYFVSRGSSQQLLICLIGFVAARYIVISRTKGFGAKPAALKKEIHCES
ncbi:MAG: ATP synthase subunit I [bacterium]|nr:ATP synthase subunit I [bacterium]